MRYYIVDVNGAVYAESDNVDTLELKVHDIKQDLYDNGMTIDDIEELELEII